MRNLFNSLTVGQRLDMVADMDNEIRTFVVDEDLIDLWLTEGCPDESDNYDYLSFATDEKSFLELVELHDRLAKKSGLIYAP